MKILEVRDGFIKFDADEKVKLSAFVCVRGEEKNYIGQVLQVKNAGGVYVAFAKLLFLYDGENLSEYDKTQPVKNADVEIFDSSILLETFNVENPVILGKTLDNKDNITVDLSAFDKKLLISSDEVQYNNILIKNLVRQFNNLDKKVVILDMQGNIDAKKIVAGVDFKLPLDTKSLEFMYEDCLNDATSDSKSLIMEIFKDLSEYSQTVPFVPFGTLKTVVDEMVDKSHVFKLLVLKNKLAKLSKTGYFASKAEEVQVIDKILASKCSVIDLSKLSDLFKNRFLSFIYEKLSVSSNTNIILELTNIISKKNIKEVLKNEKVSTTFITHPKFKYLNDLKTFFENFVIIPSVENNKLFSTYQTFLSSMPKGTCLIAGEASNYIPLVSKIENIEDFVKTVQKQIKQEELVQEPEEFIQEQQELPEINIETPDDIQDVSENYVDEKLSDAIEEKTDKLIYSMSQELDNKEVSMFSDEEEGEEDLAEEDSGIQDLDESGEDIQPSEEEYHTTVYKPEEQEEIENILPVEIPEVIEEENISEEIGSYEESDNDISEETLLTEELEEPNVSAEEELPQISDLEISNDISIKSIEDFTSEDMPSVLNVNTDDISLNSGIDYEQEKTNEQEEIELDNNFDLDLSSEETEQESSTENNFDAQTEEEAPISVMPINENND